MKEIIRKTTFIAAVAMSVAACSKNEVETLVPGEEEALKVSFTASAEATTRTTFGEKEGNFYPVHWTSNTKIALRYNTSGMTVADVTPSDDGKTAGFEASFVPETDASAHTFIAVSPATAAVSIMPNETRVSIPMEQVSSAVSCDEEAQIIRAEYTSGAFPKEVPLHFSHITAYGLVTVSGIPEGESIESIKIEADVPLSGKGRYADGKLTMDETAPKSLTVKTSEKNVWFACAPADNINTLTVSVGTDKTLYTKTIDMKVVAAPNEPVKFIAGQVSRFEVSVKDEFEGNINSAADWERFAYKVSHGDDFAGKVVTLNKSITVENLGMAKGVFNGKFNGEKHVITQDKNTCPLFETIGKNGKVAHLSAAGKFASFDDPTSYGTAVIAARNLGTIDDIVVNCPAILSVNDDDLFIGMVAIQNGGTISNCTNKSKVDIRMEVTEKARACCGGGIAAFGHTIASFDETKGVPVIDASCQAGKFINCSNGVENDPTLGLLKVTGAGNNTAVGEGAKESGSITGLSFYGGICGIACVSGTEFDQCKNYGKIARVSADGKESSDGTSASAAGGIVGISAKVFENDVNNRWVCRIGMQKDAGAAITIKNCVNTGEVVVRTRRWFDVANNNNMRGNFVGGIAGVACGEKDGKSIVISGCTNTGKVDGGWLKNKETAIGGIAGRALNASIENATVNGTIGGSNSKAAAGGFVGQAIGNVSITGTSNKSNPAFNLTTPTNASDKNKIELYWGLAVGIAINGATVNIENATVGGTVVIDGASVSISSENLNTSLCDAGEKSGSTATVNASNVTLAQ